LVPIVKSNTIPSYLANKRNYQGVLVVNWWYCHLSQSGVSIWPRGNRPRIPKLHMERLSKEGWLIAICRCKSSPHSVNRWAPSGIPNI